MLVPVQDKIVTNESTMFQMVAVSDIFQQFQYCQHCIMQHSYNPGPSQCGTDFMNFHKLEKYANVRLQILRKCFSRIQKICLHYIIALITRKDYYKELLEKIQRLTIKGPRRLIHGA